MAGATRLCFSLFFPLMGANPIGFAPISGLWIKVFVKAFPPYSFTFDTLLLLQVVWLNSALMSLLRP